MNTLFSKFRKNNDSPRRNKSQLSPIKGVNLPIITMDKIEGDPNLKTVRGPFANYEARMTKSVLKNYDVYEPLPSSKKEETV
jgi:hypothetical protein